MPRHRTLQKRNVNLSAGLPYYSSFSVWFGWFPINSRILSGLNCELSTFFWIVCKPLICSLRTCSVRSTFPGRHFGAALGFPYLTRSLSKSIRVGSAPVFLVIIFASTSIAFYPYAKDFSKLSRRVGQVCKLAGLWSVGCQQKPGETSAANCKTVRCRLRTYWSPTTKPRDVGCIRS